MNLKSLSNQNLLTQIKGLAQTERELTAEILNHLKEIEDRRLHLELGFSSLFEYATKELGYSEPQAQRRISSMRLIKEIPEIEESLKDGKLNLTNIAKVQSFFRERKKAKKPLGSSEKIQLLKRIEGVSTRQCEKELAQIHFDPEASADLKGPKNFQERFLADGSIELKVQLSPEIYEKLKTVRNLLAHKNPNPDWPELLEIICDQVIRLKNPSQRRAYSAPKVRSEEKKAKAETEAGTGTGKEPGVGSGIESGVGLGVGLGTGVESGRGAETRAGAETEPPLPAILSPKKQRWISAAVKRAVWARDQGSCSFISKITNKRCHSRHLLQIDHIQPLAFGGSNAEDNLRLLCFHHHQLQTEKAFGRPPTGAR